MEIWKEVEGYEGLYQVSNFGRIKSLKRKTSHISEIILKQSLDNYGYPIVSLCKNNKKKTKTVHRLVASAFVCNPYNFFFVFHIDENKCNNNASNLEWCDAKYNSNYGTRTDRSVCKLRQNGCKPVIQYDLNRNFIKRWNSLSEIERALGYKKADISYCCLGKYKKSYGYIWKYE